MTTQSPPAPSLSRRGFLGRGATLSALALALLSGRSTLVSAAVKTQSSAATAADIEILNAALAAEHQAIAAYQLGAESGLLVPAVRTLALTFQGHHRTHADLLGATVGQLGGHAVGPQPKYDFPAANLRTQDDVLRFAAGLEQGAVTAYTAAVPKFGDRELARVAASILGDEAMHWAVLRQALGEPPVPGAFVG